MKKLRKQRGRSMIETLGYLAVVMIVVGAIGNLISNAFSDYKQSKASLQLGDLVSAIVKASAADEDYTDVVEMIKKCNSPNSKMEGCRLIPSTYRVAGGKIYHAFGGEVAVGTQSGYASGVEDKLVITFSGLNKKQCVEMSMKDWVSNKLADLYAIKINNNLWYWEAYENDQNKLPVTRDKVAGVGENSGQCENKKTNAIMWVFN